MTRRCNLNIVIRAYFKNPTMQNSKKQSNNILNIIQSKLKDQFKQVEKGKTLKGMKVNLNHNKLTNDELNKIF